ncbi:MAG: RusA family crossover junction endodeoxyribonuclease [Dehalococcoidia bacterium]|jgi:Holliday junction resolvase RusA-like endonuclease
MTTVVRKPAFRIWVQGHPQSVQGDRKHLAAYRRRIGEAAREVVPYPTKSKRIDLEVYFQSQRALRPDVDNILKPILDALKGTVYTDDSQVRSITVVALPTDQAYSLGGWTSIETLKRLLEKPPKEFLIDIYEGMAIYHTPA